MTIATTVNRLEYTGNGSTTDFSFPYYVLESADLKVYLDGTLQTIVTHYNLSATPPQTSGVDVQFLTAPDSAASIVIIRDPEVSQSVNLIENDPLPAEEVEKALDRLTMIGQRLDDRMDRAFILSDSTVGVSTALPTPVASRLLGWNSDGDGISNYALLEDTISVSAFMETVLDDADAGTARATLSAANIAGDKFTGDIKFADRVTVASASAPAIGAAASNHILITGTTDITGFDDDDEGVVKFVEFGGILTLTQGAALQLNNNGNNILTAAGDKAIFVQTATGTQVWEMYSYLRANGRNNFTEQPGYIRGGVATNATTDAAHDIHISAVEATNDGATKHLTLAADTDRATDTLWAEGGPGLMAENGTGGTPRTLPTSGTVYLFVISKDSDGTLDFCCDDSSTGANIGTASSATDGWTVERLIDKIQTDSSANLKPFTIDGDKDDLTYTVRRFYTDTLVTITDPIGTSEAQDTMECPPNETAIVDARIVYTAAAANRHARIYPTAGDDITPAAGNSNLQVHGTQSIVANTRLEIPVDGSSQINSKADAGLSGSNLSTAGYIIHR